MVLKAVSKDFADTGNEIVLREGADVRAKFDLLIVPDWYETVAERCAGPFVMYWLLLYNAQFLEHSIRGSAA